MLNAVSQANPTQEQQQLSLRSKTRLRNHFTLLHIIICSYVYKVTRGNIFLLRE